MKFMPMSVLLRRAMEGGYAVPSFCVWSAETMVTVLTAAEKLKAPVILMSGPVEFNVPPADMANVARTVAARFSVPASLLLDHGGSLDDVKACLAAGYTAVMLDYSAKPFETNVGALRTVAEMARPLGVTVEGEVGHVGRVDEATFEGDTVSTLTEPEEAATYVARTGVDALAISIGNSHGQYTKLPQFDFARLERIREAVNVPLVLHGGSGTPDADLKRAISLGIAKVNVATDLVSTIRKTLMTQWEAGKNLWVPVAEGEALKAIVPVIEGWIHRTGAAGKA